MKWLITGGCGFIGRSLITSLIKDTNNSIRVLDNLSGGSVPDLKRVAPELTQQEFAQGVALDDARVSLLVGDIRDPDACMAAAKDVDVIVHLAANTGVGPSMENPVMDCDTNVRGTLNVLEGARANGVGRLVFASSGAPLGAVEPPVHEKLAPKPMSPYGASKLAGEGYCSAYYQAFGIDTVALRFGNVYGPGSSLKESVVAKFIRLAMNGENIEIYGDGAQTRDFIYIFDLVDAILAAQSTDGVGGEVFQIATNHETTILELVDRMQKVFTANGISNPEVIYGDKRPGDIVRNYSDTSKAKAMLGWQAEMDLDVGLQATIDYFKALS